MRLILCSLIAIAFPAFTGCSHRTSSTSAVPPDARRPELKDDATLAAERDAAIAAGQVTPTSAPVLEQEKPKLSGSATARPAPPPIPSTPDAIESDILMVNDDSLSVSEVLYSIRGEIHKARESQTPRGFVERLERLVRETARREVGTMLLYAKAHGELQEPQKKALDFAVDREVDRRIGQDFGGSKARFQRHLADYGLTVDQYKSHGRRQMVVSQYTREMLLPKIQIRRDELLAFYRANTERFSTPATRELRMIEMPYAAFLPENTTWATATDRAKAAARLAALRQCRAAAEQLSSRDFGDVARELSKGINADKGGSWGQIGAPLQAPYDKASALIFDYSEGKFSEPIETDTGYLIVACGTIVPAVTSPFLDIQEKVREQLIDERFNRLASDYIIRLAEKATLSSMDAFIQAAVRKATTTEFARINAAGE